MRVGSNWSQFASFCSKHICGCQLKECNPTLKNKDFVLFEMKNILGFAETTGPLTRRGFIQSAGAAGFGIALGTQKVHADPIPPTGSRLHILVLGAGAAGLVAAYELKQAGHRVTILEATLRPGGRVHTIREPFADGLYAEAGAGRIPSTHSLTRDYAKQFGLTLAPYKPTGENSLYYAAGRRVIARSGQPVDLRPLGLPFTADELRMGPNGMYDKYIARFSKEIGSVPGDAWPSPYLRKFGNQTIANLMASLGASPAAIKYLCAGYEEDSALDYLRDAYSHEAPELDHIAGGNDLLPRAFANALTDQIRYGTPVIRIEQDTRSVRAITRREGQNSVVSADRMICTLPFSVLRHIAFAPRLPHGKQKAINNLPYGSVTRIFLQYNRRFWVDEGCTGFADMLDLPMEIWSPSHDQPGHRGLHLGYLYERIAKEVAAFPKSQRITFFLNLMQKVYPGASKHFEGGDSFVWNDQPFQRGAYAVYPKGTYDSLAPYVSQPEGRIHFAGEHTSPWPGWIQGALYSGLRAVHEVVQAYRATQMSMSPVVRTYP
jgi:monoamine oxidase